MWKGMNTESVDMDPVNDLVEAVRSLGASVWGAVGGGDAWPLLAGLAVVAVVASLLWEVLGSALRRAGSVLGLALGVVILWYLWRVLL